VADHAAGRIRNEELAAAQDRAVSDTIRCLEEIGSPVVTDGEQAKPSFATYPLSGLDRLSPDGVVIPFADGHQRQLPRLTAGPLRYGVHADGCLRTALRYATVPVKQAVIAPSALSLLYPPDGISGYPHDAFLDDLTSEAETDIRRCLDAGTHCVQLDFPQARLALKPDPGGGLLDQFIALNNRVLERFSAAEQARIGVHTCPGGDQDSTHSLDVNYTALLPILLRLKAGAFYVQLASEPEPDKVLAVLADHLPAQAAPSLASPTRSIPASSPPHWSATASWPLPVTCPSTAWAHATTVASPPSPTTPPPPGTPPSPRSAPASKAPPWQPTNWAAES